MAWQEIHITANKDKIKDIEKILKAHGSLAITYKDAGNENLLQSATENIKNLWLKTKIVGLWSQKRDLNAVITKLRTITAIDNVHIYNLKNKNWTTCWMENYDPVAIGDDFWIYPSWIEPKNLEQINVVIDPKMAFGTGQHETTRMCIEYLIEKDIKNKTVIDYGCGSGILAISAAYLGAKKVYATDIDPDALLATKENIKLNSKEDIIEVIPIEKLTNKRSLKVDFLFANILLTPLIDLKETFIKLLLKNGQIILSGFLEEQTQMLKSNYKEFEFTCSKETSNWQAVAGKKI